MPRVFDTYAQPSAIDNTRHIAITAEPVYANALVANRSFIDMAFIAPLDLPLIFMRFHCRLQKQIADSGAYTTIEPSHTILGVPAPNVIPARASAKIVITIYDDEMTQVSSTTLTIASGVLYNNLGQHTIPAGGLMTLGLTEGLTTVSNSWYLLSFSAYLSNGPGAVI